MVWDLFQSGQIRKLREQLEHASSELTAVTSLYTDLAKRAAELERRVNTLAELERRVKALEDRLSGVERSVSAWDRAPWSDTPGEGPAAGT